jgi:hypothetical protein
MGMPWIGQAGKIPQLNPIEYQKILVIVPD